MKIYLIVADFSIVVELLQGEHVIVQLVDRAGYQTK
jgi:hypothetical protein